MTKQSAMTLEDRRAEVLSLLEEGTDLKLLRSGTQRSIAALKTALRLAKVQPRLPGPWIPLISYRLAHLVLRDARTERQLHEADQLLAAASRCRSLGPLPWLYRLPVLKRLGELDDPEEVARRLSHIGRLLAERQDGATTWADELPQAVEQQSRPFNMLELAAYFLGGPHAVLEGGGAGPFREFGRNWRPWLLLGPDPAISTVRYPEALALEELEARVDGIQGALGFRLSAQGDRARWRRGGAWEEATESSVRYLACVLARSQVDADRLAPFVLRQRRENPDPESLRQVKRRLGADIARRTGIPQADVFDEVRAGRLPMLAQGVVVYGALEEGSRPPR